VGVSLGCRASFVLAGSSQGQAPEEDDTVTRLPVDTWLVTPRLDIPAYELNTVCPVTGETSGLEDHHIWRRSFTALSKEENDALYWVEVHAGDTKHMRLLRNRVALSPEAHFRITTNVARLEYRGTDLYYVERGEEKLLNLDLHLMADGEKVTRKRRAKQASTPEERRARVNFTIRTPQDEENVLPELVEEARKLLAPEFGWGDDVPSYFVVTAALVKVIQG
jgi:hypothetical protein